MNFNYIVNTFYDSPDTINQVGAYIPQLWANESLIILQENMVAASLVHRDFSEVVADYGDTVNTRQPARFQAIRMGDQDDITDQAAIATNVPVVLNQHPHISFVIKDAQASKSFKDLVTEFLKPAMIDMSRFVDQVILAQYAQFLMNQTGQIGGLTSSTVRQYMLNARQTMNKNLAPEDTRNLLWSTTGETTALSTDLFLQAQQVGDDGTALRNATLGRKLGFDNYMSQNVANVSSLATNQVAGTGVINLSAGYVAGTTTMLISGLTAAIPAGGYISIDGRPYQVVSSVGGSTPSSVTITAPGLMASVANGASVLAYTAGAVNLSGGYAAGYVGPITVSGFTNFPSPGQIVTFGTATTTPTYVIIQADSVGLTITLDQPLGVGIANSATVNAGPAGQFNFAFHRNAIALVSRPLALPPEGIGAKAAVVNYNNISMRALIAYDSYKQGVRVSLDMLFGVKVLNTNLGAVMLG